MATNPAENYIPALKYGHKIVKGNLDTDITPSHIVKYAGEVTWTGGLITLAETVTGALATDIVIANFQTIGTEGVVIASVVTTNTVTFTLDTANTSNDAVVSYTVLRVSS